MEPIQQNAVRTFHEDFERLVKQGKNDEVKSIVKSIVADRVPLANVVDSDGNALVHFAAKYNNFELIKFLVSSGCDVNAKNSSRQTPLFIALSKNHLEATEALINAKADISTDDAEAHLRALIVIQETLPASPLIALMQKLKNCSGDSENMAALLLKVHCPLRLVVMAGDARLTESTLARPDYQTKDEDSEAALTYAMEALDFENLRVLWRSDRTIRTRKFLLWQMNYAESFDDSNKQWLRMKPLFERLTDWIVLNGDFSLFLENTFSFVDKRDLQLLLQRYNVDAQIKQAYGLDVLPILFYNEQLDIEDLLDAVRTRKFDVNAKSVHGCTALHYAARIDSIERVRLLLDLGADCNVKHDRGFTPLFSTYDECTKLLLQSGASLHIVHNCDRTLLEIILQRHNSEDRDELELGDDDSEDIGDVEDLLSQLAIDHYKDVRIRQEALDEINRNQSCKDHYEHCLQQVKILMDREIPPALTLFTAMTMEPESLALQVQSQETISKIMELCPQQSFHSYYHSLLKLNLEKAYNMYGMRRLLAATISESTSIPIGFDHLVIDRICGLLSYRDILAFISK